MEGYATPCFDRGFFEFQYKVKNGDPKYYKAGMEWFA
jgi:hypothetical protein